MEEKWRWIPGFEGQYQASTFGRIRSFKQSKDGLIMKGAASRDGRIRVNLNGKKYLVHRLILLTFKPEERTQDDIVMHIDGDPTNNNLNNLQWGTYKENAQDNIAISRNKMSQQSSKQHRKEEQNIIIPGERWKDIEGYNGDYQISDYGRVKSFKSGKPHIMSLILQTTQLYYTVGLSKNKKKKHYSVNRLVAEAFVDNPNNYTEVNHIDEDTLNNYYKNLEWCNHSQNVKHSIYRQSIPIAQYDLKDNLIATYDSIMDAARKTLIFNTNIRDVLDKENRTAGGYKWKKLTKGDNVNGAQGK